MLHDDWEIYGDGTGDPEVLMFEPAKRLLDICDRYGAKYTFYAEIGQQINMLNAPGSKWKKYANTWEMILKDAIARSHDVQLHLHPQWIGSVLKNDKWQLDVSKWHSGHVEPELLDEWIGRGKYYLKNLLQPVNNDYRVLSFRAGGWMCQSSNGLYQALKKHEIVCDVSVLKGRYRRYEDGSVVDFRNAVSCYEPWEVHPDDFARAQKGCGVWELPLFTKVSSLPPPVYMLSKSFQPCHYFNIYQKQKTRKGGVNYYPKVIETGKLKEYYGNFGYMHHSHLESYVRHIKDLAKTNANINHLIFLTHSKSFLDFENFEKLLKNLNSQGMATFTTTRKHIEEYLMIK
jgi:peptidoglycan/xylan/chitin deacetylase (PgdA/CDA1 family)